MNERISVIVPVYNVADYLMQCAQSILEQDYKALEVLLIDDGSTDGSGILCDEIAAGDSRVKVIHQKNAGAAAAKNAGLRAATGDYLSFVDSDDYLEPGAYRYMVDTLHRTGADAAQFGFRSVYMDGAEEMLPRPEILDGITYLKRLLGDWTCPLLWNKLYRRELYDGIFFEEGHKIDDEYFTYQGFLRTCTIAVEERIVYNYRRRASSVMCAPESGQRRILDKLDSIEKRREKIMTIYPQMKKELNDNYWDALWYLSWDSYATRETILLLRSRMQAHLKNSRSIPPRWLWGRLLKTYFAKPETMLAQIQENIPQQGYRFFA